MPSMLLKVACVSHILCKCSRHRQGNAVSTEQTRHIQISLRFEGISLHREGPSDVLQYMISLCSYRGKHASWEQKGYIRSGNQSGNVCKENMQAPWNLSPVSAQRPTLTGELVLLSHGVLYHHINSTGAFLEASV